MRLGAEHSVPKPLIVAVALKELGGASKLVDTEDIAMKAYELAPQYFCWRKYPQQIDLDIVRLSLRHASEDKHGRLLEGSVRKGWSLTEDGLVKLRLESARIVEALKMVSSSTPRPSGRSEDRKRSAERRRILNSEAWANWRRQMPISYQSASELFRVDDYTDPRTRTLKVRRLIELMNSDQSVGEFVRAMATVVRWASKSEESQNESNGNRGNH